MVQPVAHLRFEQKFANELSKRERTKEPNRANHARDLRERAAKGLATHPNDAPEDHPTQQAHERAHQAAPQGVRQQRPNKRRNPCHQYSPPNIRLYSYSR